MNLLFAFVFFRSQPLNITVKDPGTMKENIGILIDTTKELQDPACHRHHLVDQESPQVGRQVQPCFHIKGSFVQ